VPRSWCDTSMIPVGHGKAFTSAGFTSHLYYNHQLLYSTFISSNSIFNIYSLRQQARKAKAYGTLTKIIIVVASVDGHMADDNFNGCARDSKREPIVTRWYVSWSNICCCSLSNVIFLSRITTINRSTVLLLVPTA